MAAPARSPSAPRRLTPWAATLGLVGALTALRLLVLFTSPLELYPDEAQYWLWSRRLAFGYFSKPPMIAWMIRATTALGGDGEAWVRLGAPLAHAAAALLLHRAAARFHDARAGFWAAAVYSLMPGVQLSSAVIATDAPLMAFLGAALWALGAMWRPDAEGGPARARAGLAAAAGLGAALGLACLAKYAALYYALGLAGHALSDPPGRRRLWSTARLWTAVAAFLAIVAPNLLWNASHGFETVAHTAANASLGEAAGGGAGVGRWLDPRGPLGFLAGQFAVFGPAPLVALGLAAAPALGQRRSAGQVAPSRASTLLLAWLVAVPLVVVLGEAAAVRANANWAAAAYPAGAVLVGGWAATPGRRRALAAGLGLQVAFLAVLTAVLVSPGAADRLGAANSLKRARGWRISAQAVHGYLRELKAAGVSPTALAVDDRFLFNALAYYGRDWIAAPGAPPLRMWVHENRALNQAEAQVPLTRSEGARVAFASTTWPRQSAWDFAATTDRRTVEAPLDARRARRILLYLGLGFAPRPRDPVTGLPTPP